MVLLIFKVMRSVPQTVGNISGIGRYGVSMLQIWHPVNTLFVPGAILIRYLGFSSILKNCVLGGGKLIISLVGIYHVYMKP